MARTKSEEKLLWKNWKNFSADVLRSSSGTARTVGRGQCTVHDRDGKRINGQTTRTIVLLDSVVITTVSPGHMRTASCTELRKGDTTV
eukprot:2884610-Rhodomonas_salina.2